MHLTRVWRTLWQSGDSHNSKLSYGYTCLFILFYFYFIFCSVGIEPRVPQALNVLFPLSHIPSPHFTGKHFRESGSGVFIAFTLLYNSSLPLSLSLSLSLAPHTLFSLSPTPFPLLSLPLPLLFSPSSFKVLTSVQRIPSTHRVGLCYPAFLLLLGNNKFPFCLCG